MAKYTASPYPEPEGVGGLFGEFLNKISSAARVLLFEWPRKIITSLISMAAMWCFHAIIRIAPGTAKWMFDLIVTTYYTGAEEWVAFIAKYFEYMTDIPFSAEVKEIMMNNSFIAKTNIIARVGDVFLEPMLNLILPDPSSIIHEWGFGYQELRVMPADAEQMDKLRYGFLGAERFLGTNLQFQMSAWLLHFLGDVQSFGMFKSLKDLPNAISWSYGIGWLSWLVMGVPFRKAISEPMEKYYNRVYMSAEFGTGQIIEAQMKGLLQQGAYYDIMRDLGYDNWHSYVLYTLAQKDFSDSHIKRLMSLGWMTDAQAQTEFQARGYSPAKAQTIVALIKGEGRLDIIDKIVDEARNLYLDGVMSTETYRQMLYSAGKDQDSASLLILYQDLRRQRRRFLTPAQIDDLYERGLIARAQALAYLEYIGYTAADSTKYLELQEAKRASTA